jgi:hypothetical protein
MIDATTSVGTFGGYAGRAIRWLPTRNGLLTFVHDGRPSALQLLWSFGKSGTRVLGEARVDAASDAPVEAKVHGWTTFEMREPGVRALVSRAWPAVRLHYEGTRVEWRTQGTKFLGVVQGRAGALRLPLGPGALSEPWIVVHGHGEIEDAAMLLTFSRPPTRLARTEAGIELRFERGTVLHAMPLEGIRRRTAKRPPLAHFTAAARAWVAPLLAFPVACSESAEVRADGIRVTAAFEHEILTDDFGNAGRPLAPFPPSVALTATAGYPVELPANLVQNDAQLVVPTFFGPFQFVFGRGYAYGLPLPVSIEGASIPLRSRAPSLAPIREELLRVVDTMGDPTPDFVDNNLRVVSFLADAMPELDAPRRAAARAFTASALEGAMATLHRTTEPFSNQPWSTLGKTWRSHFAETDPPWGKDQERFDSEFYNGQALSALDASIRIDPRLGGPYFDQAKELYRYDQLFFDWATGSVLTHATGDSANVDGAQFAWEGMLAMARMAQRRRDTDLRTDALYRAARQQAALFAMWHQAAWTRRWNYAIGHTTGGRLAAKRVKTVGPVDAFVEEYGAAMLEFESFWQCTCFLFFANRPLLDFFRAYGLVDRIRSIEYDLMPSLHPSWQDGNATDAHAENGQSSYGTTWTAAHLLVRASLFDDDRLALFRAYDATKSTAAATTWYRMQVPQVAGPLLLALLEEGPAVLIDHGRGARQNTG